MSRKACTAVLVATASLALALIATPGMIVVPRPAPDCPCEGKDAVLVVDTASKHLWVCRRGVAVASYRVGLGRGGAGKRSKGDGKTPLGEYELGRPRPSRRFHLFIPVGYPTAAQRRRGFTGGGIGIHGPSPWIRWLPGGATWFNRTRGCIELGSVREVEQVARWVRDGTVTRIEIR